MTDPEDRITALEARLDAISKRQGVLIGLLIGEQRELADGEVETARNVFDQLADLEDEIQQVEDIAASAAASAKQRRADGGQGQTKVQIAEEIARDTAVKRLVQDSSVAEGSGVTVSEVQERGKPQHEFRYQTVKDAFRNLSQTWHECRVKTDPRKLVVKRDAVSKELAAAVEDSLGRENLTKRLISEKQQGGGV
jgi:hypothetical protein